VVSASTVSHYLKGLRKKSTQIIVVGRHSAFSWPEHFDSEEENEEITISTNQNTS